MTTAIEDPVVIGKIVRSIGVKGEVKVVFASGDPQRLEGMTQVVVRLPDGNCIFEIMAFQSHPGYARVALAGVDSIERAELLRNGELIASVQGLPDLVRDEYYIDRLIGCLVETADGEHLGTLQDVVELGHHDVWSVRGPRGEILIPARKEFIVRVDIEARRVIVRRIAGLWDGA